MKKSELRELREAIGTQVAVGKQLSLTKRTIQRFEAKGYPVPAWYELALIGLAKGEKTA